MNILPGKVVTAAKRKINEMIVGYNTNVTNIANNLSLITAIMSGNGIAEQMAAAGTDAVGAGALASNRFIHRISGAVAAAGAAGVKLPSTPSIGTVHIIINPENAVLKIYPGAAEKIDSGTAGAAISGTALYTYIMIYESAAVGWNTTKFLVAD
jgi:hypothetical protein